MFQVMKDSLWKELFAPLNHLWKDFWDRFKKSGKWLKQIKEYKHFFFK